MRKSRGLVYFMDQSLNEPNVKKVSELEQLPTVDVQKRRDIAELRAIEQREKRAEALSLLDLDQKELMRLAEIGKWAETFAIGALLKFRGPFKFGLKGRRKEARNVLKKLPRHGRGYSKVSY